LWHYKQPSLLWSAKVGEDSERQAVKFAPFATEKFVFTVDREGQVTAFDINSGAQTWRTKLNKDITAGISGDDDNLYVASSNGEVFAISQLHGGTIWTSSVSSEVIASPVAGLNFVVVRSLDGKIYSLDKRTGERRWIYTYSVPALSIHGNGRPVIVTDGVLAGLDNGRLVALRDTDGRVFWETSLGDGAGRSEVEKLNDLDADLQIFEPYIYAVNYQGKLAQIDPAQGKPSWSADVSSVSGLTVTEEAVFVTDEFDSVLAFSRATGQQLWKQERLADRRLTAPVSLKDGTVLVGDLQGYLHLLSPTTGGLIGRLQSGVGEIVSRPVIRDDKLFVQGRRGKLAAVSL